MLSQGEDNMIKRLSIIQESDIKSYKDSSRWFDLGRSSYTKNFKSESIKMMKKEHSRAVPIQISLRLHHKVAEEARGSDSPWAGLQDF